MRRLLVGYVCSRAALLRAASMLCGCAGMAPPLSLQLYTPITRSCSSRTSTHSTCPQICEPEPLSLLVPPEAEPFLVPESATCNRPFSLKHAQQQVGIHSGTGYASGPLLCPAGPPPPCCSSCKTQVVPLPLLVAPGLHCGQHEAARAAGGSGAEDLHRVWRRQGLPLVRCARLPFNPFHLELALAPLVAVVRLCNGHVACAC